MKHLIFCFAWLFMACPQVAEFSRLEPTSQQDSPISSEVTAPPCGLVNTACCPSPEPGAAGICRDPLSYCRGAICVPKACAPGGGPCHLLNGQVVECCVTGQTCQMATNMCQSTLSCATFGQTCLSTSECCSGLQCLENQCRFDPSQCIEEEGTCDPELKGLDCCEEYSLCEGGKCRKCLRRDRPVDAETPCCEPITYYDAASGGLKCGGCMGVGSFEKSCVNDSDCCNGLTCRQVDKNTRQCFRTTRSGGECDSDNDCPAEAPVCLPDDKEVKRCTPAETSPVDAGPSDAGMSPKKSCHHDVDCNQAAGEACCLSPTSSGGTDFCDESRKNTCYVGMVCGGPKKECSGSANPWVCPHCKVTCVDDLICNRAWEDERCADCQNLCEPCMKNGRKVECGIDPSCGTGRSCGNCSTCDPLSQMCQNTYNACGSICASVQNCAPVLVSAGLVSCPCTPNFSCPVGQCSPNGLTCEHTTVSLGDSTTKEPCTWCGGASISYAQCLACGGYVQGNMCREFFPPMDCLME